MKHIWSYIENKKWPAKKKYKAALFLYGCMLTLIGFLLWLLLANWFSFSRESLVCFLEYPAVCSFFGVFYYANNHDFHDGNKKT